MNYVCLNNNNYQFKEFKIVPIRKVDRYKIMKWRNEQKFHLRQKKDLTREIQDEYFSNIIHKAFLNPLPDQILFSYIENNKCIGYGGLVHIDWYNKNAEISFIMETELESKHFINHWSNFLKLIEKVAFDELKFNKIYTYAYDLRPLLYKVLEKNEFVCEAILKYHQKFENKYINIVIHSKIYNL
jgi:RimJ/RimL family protein N-acetyltransferase